MQKIITTVKYWIINWFLSWNKKIIWNDKGQMVRLSTAGDWMEGYKSILEKKSWPTDVQITWEKGVIPAAQTIGSYPREPGSQTINQGVKQCQGVKQIGQRLSK